MGNRFQRLLTVLTGSTQHDLRQQVQFLKAENEVLRSRLPMVIRTTRQERRRLIKLGKPLGCALKDLITIVKPQTFTKWMLRERKNRRQIRHRRPGRPRTNEHIRRLIILRARETDWGYTRILGELRKLGINRLSRKTIANILFEEGFEPAPNRGEDTWRQFLRRHAKTLWACDFVSQKIITKKGMKEAFFLIFIHIKSRRVIVTESTLHPDAAWVAERAERLIEKTKNDPDPPRILLRDRDSKFSGGRDLGEGRSFDTVLNRARIRPMVLPFRSPNLNAFAERFIQTLRRECLNRFVVLGAEHLDYLNREFVDYYNRQRPHSSLERSKPPDGPSSPASPSPPNAGKVICQLRLGGIIRHFSRAA